MSFAKNWRRNLALCSRPPIVWQHWFCRREHLRRRSDHCCNRHARTGRMPQIPSTIVPRIIADNLPTVFPPPLFGANFGQPELHTLAPVPPLWPPSRLYRLDSLSDPIGRCPLSSPPEPVGFRAEFQPATVAVAASDYSCTFKVVRATDPSHWPVLGRRWSPEPARASTAAGEPPFGLDSAHLWPRLRLSSPPPWLPSCHGLGAPEFLLRFAGVEARPSQSLDPVTARSWSDPLADPFNQPG